MPEYSDWFEGPRRSLLTWYPSAVERPPYSSRQRRLAYLATRCAWQASKVLGPLSLGRIARVIGRPRTPQDLKSVIAAAQAANTHTLFLQGYYFRHIPWVVRHAESLRAFFRPCLEHRIAANVVVDALRQTSDIVVAIHLRHGDYQFHKGGRYFWPVTTYRTFIDRICDLLAPARVGFMICSNAAHDPAHFAGLTWRAGPGSVPSDLYAMSRCDYILGPPSTFSSWAAFLGRARLLHLLTDNQPFGLDDFTVQDHPRESLALPDPAADTPDVRRTTSGARPIRRDGPSTADD